MTLLLSPSLKQAVCKHAEEIYPDECCGILGGYVDEQGRNCVTAVFRVENHWEQSEKRRRYVMQPSDVLQAEKEFKAAGHHIVGFYHSHPDHPAKPSQFDLDHASWPSYSYVIVSVHKGVKEKITSWQLREDRSAFDEEELLEENI